MVLFFGGEKSHHPTQFGTIKTTKHTVMAEQYFIRFGQSNLFLDRRTDPAHAPLIQLTRTAECDVYINDRRVLLIRYASEVPATTSDDGVPVVHIGAGERLRVELRAKDVGDVAVAESAVTVQGDVRGAVSTASGNVTVQQDVKGSVTTMSGEIRVRGAIQGSAATMSGNIEANSVDRDASSLSGRVRTSTRW